MKIVHSKAVHGYLINESRSALNGKSFGSKYLDRSAITFSLVYDAKLSIEKIQDLCQIDESTVYRRVKAFTDHVLTESTEDKKKEADQNTCSLTNRSK